MSGFGVAARALHLVSGLGLVGLATAMLLVRRSDRPTALAWDARMLRWARGLAGLALLSGLGVLAHQTALVTGRPAAALEPLEWARLLARSQFGTVWLLRHGLLLLLAALLLLREQERSDADRLALHGQTWLLAGLAAAATAWAGHAAAAEPSALAAALLDALHLLAAGAWFGALLPLTALLRAAARESGADARALAVLAVRRFSRLAVGLMAVVIATGLANAWFQVGGVAALIGTPYGWILLGKLSLLVPILLLVRHGRSRLLPRLSGDGETVGRPAMRRLALFVAAEAALALLVLVASAALGLSVPAAHDSPWWPFPYRYSWEVAATVPSGRTRVMLGGQLAFLGLAATVVGLLLRSWRLRLVGIGVVALAVGLRLALPPLTVDAYPTTFRGSAVSYDSASVARGVALYREHCAPCHGPGGRGDGPAGAGLPRPPADLTAPHIAQHTAGDMFWWLTHGIPAAGMPAFGAMLSEDQRWDLINLIRTLAAGERARGMTALVPPSRPWLVAPDLAIAVGPAPPQNLKDLRRRTMVLVVLFTLPGSRPRLVQLAEAYERLQTLGTEVVAVPVGRSPHVLRRLGDRPPILFPVVTDGAGDIALTYALLAHRAGSGGPSLQGPGALHAEFLLDRQGYVRARWLAGAPGPGWDALPTLLAQIETLDREIPEEAPPDVHVH